MKRIIILDICAIAAGFILRAIAGGVATNTYLSPWFLLCTAMLALFLGVEKRKAEIRLLAHYGGSSRAVLRRYSLPLLHRIENVVSTGSVMSYALWSFGPQVKGASTSWMLLTFPFVLYGIFRYQLLSDLDEIGRRKEKGNINHEKTERPEEILLTDLPLLINLISWVVTISIILFLKNKGLIN